MDATPKRSIVVTMPFGQHLDGIYQRGIRPAIERFGLEPVRLDEKCFTGSMVQGLVQEISQAAVFIAEITEGNPNVMYELGYADALRKPTIPIVHSLHDRDVPFDIRDRQYVTYSDERDLRDKLAARIPLVISQADAHWESFRSSYERVVRLGMDLTPFLTPIAQRYLELWRQDVEALGSGSAPMPSGERVLITRKLVDVYLEFSSVQRFPAGDPRKIYTPNWLRFMEDISRRKDVRKRWILMMPRSSFRSSSSAVRLSKTYYHEHNFEVAFVDPVTVEKALNGRLPEWNAYERFGPIVKYLKVGSSFHDGGTPLPLQTVLRVANHGDLQLWSIINENLEPIK